MENKKLSFEDLGVTPEDFDNPKVRISIMLPSKDILALKKEALEKGKKYQPLIQEIIHNHLHNEETRDWKAMKNQMLIMARELALLKEAFDERQHKEASPRAGTKKAFR